MISYQNKEKLENLLSEVFTYSIINKYSLNAVGDYIANSFYFSKLEKNDDSFLLEQTSEKILKEVLHLNFEPILEENNLIIADWLAMIYLEIFFQYKKSWSFIFLYLPIENAYQMFDVYHEMDISQIFLYFERKVKETNLFPKILKLKGYTTKQLAVLSGININTLNGYSKSNKILFGASNYNIKLISQILDVKDDLFLENIFISQCCGNVLLDKEEDQYLKDSFLFTNTKNILEEIDFYKANNHSYEELIQMINKFITSTNDNKLVIKVDDIHIYNETNNNIYFVSDSIVKDSSNNKIKEVPSIVKEYALIKADVRPYGNKYKI